MSHLRCRWAARLCLSLLHETRCQHHCLPGCYCYCLRLLMTARQCSALSGFAEGPGVSLRSGCRGKQGGVRRLLSTAYFLNGCSAFEPAHSHSTHKHTHLRQLQLQPGDAGRGDAGVCECHPSLPQLLLELLGGITAAAGRAAAEGAAQTHSARGERTVCVGVLRCARNSKTKPTCTPTSWPPAPPAAPPSTQSTTPCELRGVAS